MVTLKKKICFFVHFKFVMFVNFVPLHLLKWSSDIFI